MKRPFVLLPAMLRIAMQAGVLLLVLEKAPAGVIEVEPQAGHAAAQINWTDETNTTHNLSQFSGYPLIVLPIYTRCRTACVRNVAQLKKALADSSADPRQFRVLLFSFDATDTPAALARYREREAIPLNWAIGTAAQSNIDALLDSLAFPVGKAGSEFAHPNMVLFLDANLRVAHWLYGTDYSTRDVDAALRIASGDSSWVAQHSEWLYALLLFAGSLLCVALCYSLLQFKARRRFTIVQPATR
jgi:cytochrome oxidase Cu insertion factor (SCO1/SenC/PrrC family)